MPISDFDFTPLRARHGVSDFASRSAGLRACLLESLSLPPPCLLSPFFYCVCEACSLLPYRTDGGSQGGPGPRCPTFGRHLIELLQISEARGGSGGVNPLASYGGRLDAAVRCPLQKRDSGIVFIKGELTAYRSLHIVKTIPHK